MGNNISGETTRTAPGALDSYVSELGADIIYEKSLGASRFLKTVKGRHPNGPVVIKIFIKPDPGLSLRNYKKRLKTEREALARIPNIYSYQTSFETEKAGYMIRQWLYSSLYDRISTRPFLSTIERKWIAFQILIGMQEARNEKISHGDLKSENILVTSWNWVYITDFGSIKPVFLPDNDPTDYSFYFDTSGRRTCYLAPERFFSQDSETSKRKSELESEFHRDGKVTEAMDVFSAGCVIAEMFLEGRSTFTFSQLFKYRTGQLSMEAHLSVIQDEDIRSMVSSMIALDPDRRPTFSKLLESAKGSTFPESFYTFFHQYILSVNEVEAPVTAPTSPFSKLHTASTGTSTPLETGGIAPPPSSDPLRLPNDSDTRIERIWTDFVEIEASLAEVNMDATIRGTKKAFLQPDGASARSLQDVIPVELDIPGRTAKLVGGPLGGQKAAAQDGPALIMLSLVTANIRNCSLPSSKVRALDILLALAGYLTDEAKHDRLVPYVLDLLHDDSVLVRGAAIRTLVQVLTLVSAITTFNRFIIPEYILPNIRHLGHDPDVSVRCIYAQCIVPLADTAMQYLEMSQALKAHGTFKAGDQHDFDEASSETTYATAVQELHALIQEQLVTLLVDPSSTVKRAILHNISELCVFFGRQKTNDVLLSHIITYLNDRDWMLRWAFFDSIVGVAACVGSRSLEEYILPLMIQALSDVEEAVVAKVLASLTSLSELSMFQKMRIWELMSAVIGFLYHPNIWIRQGAVAFLASAAKKLPSTDVWCILYPSLRSLLRSDISAITEQHLLMTVKPPLSRKIFDTAVAWAMKGDKSQYWKNISPRAKSGVKQESGKDALASLRKSSTLSSSKYAGVRSEEDDNQIARLQALGMTQTEEIKVVALRDYILKLANSTLNFQRERQEGGQGQNIHPATDYELQKLGVTPHTVFFGVKDNRPVRPDVPRRGTRDSSGRRISFSGTPRTSRLNSIDPNGREVLAVEDLRRRIAQMDGSTTSLSVPSSTAGTSQGVSRRESLTSIQSMINSPANTDVSSMQTTPVMPTSLDVYPSSPSESVMSGGINVLRRKHQKAAPAMVGSINANVAGVLEAPKPRTMDEDPAMTSGRTSPISMAGTVRGQPHVSRKTSMQQYTTYEGQEPGINNLLEAVYQDHFRDPTTDFGPRVHQGPIRRRNTARSSFSTRDPTSRKAEANLIAHYNSHAGAINGIAVAPDHAFFVSCSDDKTVKVWDTARLERNVTSKPRHTYTQHHARVTCVCVLEAAHCFASAAEDGGLHVVRVPMSQTSSAPKYKQLMVIREHRVDHAAEYITCMHHYNTESTSNLVYATTLGNVVVLDLRTMRILLTMEDARHHGSITAMCIDRKRAWLLTGTSTGVLTLWDLRFGLKLKSWKVAAASASSSSLTHSRVHQLVIHPTKGKGRWVMVAVETQQTSQQPVSNRSSSYGVTLIEVWDLEKDVIVETFNTEEIIPVIIESNDSQSSPSSLRDAEAAIAKEAEKSPAAAIAALVQARRKMQEKENLAQDDTSPHLREAEVEAEDRKRLEARLKRVAIRAMVTGADFGGLGASGARLARADAGDVYYPGMSPSENGAGVSNSSAIGRGGFLITGSEDKKIRLWDLGRIEKSTVISGLEVVNDKPVFKNMKGATEKEPSSNTESVLSTGSGLDRPALRTNLIAHHQQQLLKPHQDCITAVACIDSPFRCGIVSGDRSGVIKVFRIETE